VSFTAVAVVLTIAALPAAVVVSSPRRPSAEGTLGPGDLPAAGLLYLKAGQPSTIRG
jgi:hypothetical protein